MKTKTVELHLLQSFPPSCVNRDGNNSPKDCVFGDYRRARISSQCLKRAIRQSDIFAEIVGEPIASRSKQMRDKKVIPYLLEKGLDQTKAEEMAGKFCRELAKDDKKVNRTSVGLYFGDAELFRLLDKYRSGEQNWQREGGRSSVDVALFGRMLAEKRELNVDAASQVAHAISTHKLSQDLDYWTAVDDLKADDATDDAGAGMLGISEFNASVFYRYACVSLPILSKNLKDDELVAKTVEAFLAASHEAMPTGKLSGHAHSTPPFAALGVVRRKGMPLNLCNAFLSPVKPKPEKGLDQVSAEALLEHLRSLRTMVLVDDADYFFASSLPNFSGTQGVERVEGYVALVKSVIERL